MDARSSVDASDPVVIVGRGHIDSAACDPVPYLKDRKTRKFMGIQDQLAVVGAGLALESAGLSGSALGESAGLYLAVGYIPFEESDIQRLMENSVDEHGFSMTRFSTEGFFAVHPHLTFRCLTNMPAFHVSANFDIQGSSFVTYPGPGQFYLAMEEALCALEAGSIQVALVGAVAHQRNFLVSRLFARLEPPILADDLVDAAGFLVLERRSHAMGRGARIQGRLLERHLSYRPHHPFEEAMAPSESFEGGVSLRGERGAASLPVSLSMAPPGIHRHRLETRDGLRGSSVWEIA